jgi:hypothetical protein
LIPKKIQCALIKLLHFEVNLPPPLMKVVPLSRFYLPALKYLPLQIYFPSLLFNLRFFISLAFLYFSSSSLLFPIIPLPFLVIPFPFPCPKSPRSPQFPLPQALPLSASTQSLYPDFDLKHRASEPRPHCPSCQGCIAAKEVRLITPYLLTKPCPRGDMPLNQFIYSQLILFNLCL